MSEATQGLNRNAKAEVFATGFLKLEGASVDREGNIYVVEKPRGLVHRITPAGEVSPYSEMPVGPNGSTWHGDGRLFCTNPICRSIYEIPVGGGAGRVFVDHCSEDGQPFLGPNDLRFSKNGDLYFTDPEGSTVSNPIGCVYWATPDGYVRRFASGLAYPNGLAFTVDWSTLLVAESHTQRIHAYRLNADGSAGEHWIYAQLEGIGPEGRPGQPDGIAFGADGNLYVAHFDMHRIAVVDPQGVTICALPIPGCYVTNLAFAGTKLYVTEGSTHTVYRLDVGVRGQPFFCGWQP